MQALPHPKVNRDKREVVDLQDSERMYKLLNLCLWQHQKWSDEESHENDRRLHLMPS